VSINSVSYVVLEPIGGSVTAIMALYNETSISGSAHDVIVNRYIFAGITVEVRANAYCTSFVYHVIESCKCVSLRDMRDNVVVERDIGGCVECHTDWSEIEDNIVCDLDVG